MTRPMSLVCARCDTVGERPPSNGLPEGWGTLTVKTGRSVQTFRDLCPTCLAPVEALA